MISAKDTFDSDIENISLEANGLSFGARCLGTGPVLLCLHGFPDTNETFHAQFAAVADAGYRVVAPMMRGYETASQPSRNPGDYHVLRVAQDVIAWADSLSDDPVHLFGHDWGALAAYVACTRAPEGFASLVTLGMPAPQQGGLGFSLLSRQLRKSGYAFFFQLPGVSSIVLPREDFRFVERLWSRWSPGWEWDPALLARCKDTLRKPGVLRSALSYYRAVFRSSASDRRQMRAVFRSPVPVPTLVLTGAEDGCVDTEIYEKTMDYSLFPAGLQIERLLHAGHFAHQEVPERVNELLLSWLTQHPASDGPTSPPQDLPGHRLSFLSTGPLPGETNSVEPVMSENAVPLALSAGQRPEIALPKGSLPLAALEAPAPGALPVLAKPPGVPAKAPVAAEEAPEASPKTSVARLYILPTCNTCRKARRYLQDKAVAFQEISLDEAVPSMEDLQSMLSLYNGKVKRLFNTSGVEYREKKLKDKLQEMSDEEALAMLRGNGRLLRRPFLVCAPAAGAPVSAAPTSGQEPNRRPADESEFGRVGFKPQEWDDLFSV